MQAEPARTERYYYERMLGLLKQKDNLNEQNRILYQENLRLRAQVKKMLNIEPCTKSKPDPKTPQQWLSMPLRHFPKKLIGSRLLSMLELETWPDRKEQERSAQLGDSLLVDPNSLKGRRNIGKVTIKRLADWQAKWRQEFGDDYEKELKIWEAS